MVASGLSEISSILQVTEAVTGLYKELSLVTKSKLDLPLHLALSHRVIQTSLFSQTDSCTYINK